MRTSRYSEREWQAILSAFACLRIEGEPPPYLRDYLALRLQNEFPDLAARIWQASDEQMRELCRLIQEAHRLRNCLAEAAEPRINGNGVSRKGE